LSKPKIKYINIDRRGFAPSLIILPLSFEGVYIKGELKRGEASLI